MPMHYMDPNNFTAESDSQMIQMAVDEASRSGCNMVVIPALNRRTGTFVWEISETIELPSHMYIEINNAHLRMKDGVFCQMFRNSNALEKAGQTEDGLQEDIIIQGVGRAVLDGGKHNGLRERTSCKDGMPHILHNLTIYFHNVRNFKIDGLTIRDQRYWGITFAWAWEGIVSNIRFEITDKSVRESLTNPWRNQDGIDLRVGCHDIQIMNLSGETCDDIVALTALAIPDGGSFENLNPCDHLPWHIYNVSIRNIIGFNNHCAMVRLLCHNRNQIFNISIDNLIDATPDSHSTDVPKGIRTASCVKLGECDYYRGNPANRCRPGDMRNISISNVFSNALCAVVMNCAAKDVVIRNVFVNPIGAHAVAVSKIKFGIHHELENPVNVSHCENILVDGVNFASQRPGNVPFFFHGLVAKNFRVRNVNITGNDQLVQYVMPQADSEEVIFENVSVSEATTGTGAVL